jgi:uncharacterized membrane protein
MVDVERNADTYRCCFILRPNCSLSWRGTLAVFFSLCVVSGVIATGMTLLGFWMVLPLAGLEMLALGGGLYVVACRSHACEVIFITEDSIRIEKGMSYPRQHWTLARVWAHVVLERCPAAWYPSRLLICSHGRVVEVGRFLNEEERRRLAAELTRSL